MADVLPDHTHAVEISEPGGPEVLRLVPRPMPEPDTGEVLIAVGAAGVNRPDVFQREGRYPPPEGASDIPGLEVAGTIRKLGPNVSGLNEGDTVVALVPGGGYASYCVAPAAVCLPIPEGYDAVHAAALPEAAFTVYGNLFERGRLRPGETLLVHGGSSGIGQMAIQMAKAFGARVFATAGSAEKCRACEQAGAERAVNYREEDFVEVVKSATGGGVNVVLDMVGGDYIQRNMKALAPEGRLIFIAFLKGATAEVDFTPVMLKRLSLTGSTLRARELSFKATLAAKLRAYVWPLLERKAIRTRVHCTYRLSEAADAHRLMESSQHIGKIVLVPDA
ncbi:putative NAD(P)H quinone oxidoreductase, PIG3 family [Limimonas halophila]|uniref:Putative NAD(P)H quinone oxidoreductase, PIG3 family n=1 Tax=Limimonas halophila TaxID=1082479 RepID=A0A1G7KUQ8_9PROT|nr:NAD(P)H-quinone oxidoreductase [Limimonas halophila]SDF40977.1 putative NAD(P)H quinone oxidoreductase, PIG3 family [Limimonas halophila]